MLAKASANDKEKTPIDARRNPVEVVKIRYPIDTITEPYPIRLDVDSFFTNTVFTIEPITNPPPAILTRDPYMLFERDSTSFEKAASSESTAAVITSKQLNKQ